MSLSGRTHWSGLVAAAAIPLLFVWGCSRPVDRDEFTEREAPAPSGLAAEAVSGGPSASAGAGLEEAAEGRPAEGVSEATEGAPAELVLQGEPTRLPAEGESSRAGGSPGTAPIDTSPVEAAPPAEPSPPPVVAAPIPGSAGGVPESGADAGEGAPMAAETPEAASPAEGPEAGAAAPAGAGNPLRSGQTGLGPLRGASGEGSADPAFEPALAGKVIGKNHGPSTYDPVKENGPIFEGWPKPKLAIVITGRQDGYLEPCGCAGLERMKGGLTRRHSFFQQLRNERGWPVVALDAGGLVKGFGLQAELKLQMTVNAMWAMRYDAIALGTSDLKRPASELLSVATVDDQALFLSANVALFQFEYEMTPRQEVVEAGGTTVGVTAVLGKKYQEELNNPDLEMIDPEPALAKQVAELKDQCDLLILLAHATREESIALGKRFPELDAVVTSDGPAEPPLELATIEGTDTWLVEVGQKGMYAVVLGIYEEGGRKVRYQRVPMDSRFVDSPDMKRLMVHYQEQLAQAGFDGLGLRPLPHPQRDVLGDFVGSQKCESCHELSYKVWKKSGHAKAWDTLIELDPPRVHDPECVSCHVVGWDPQHYFPYETGFWSRDSTPKLIDVGCESCHGPGEAHVKAEMGSDAALQAQLQKAVTLTLEEARKRQCVTCHDGENSPDFDFETYWPKIEHRED